MRAGWVDPLARQPTTIKCTSANRQQNQQQNQHSTKHWVGRGVTQQPIVACGARLLTHSSLCAAVDRLKVNVERCDDDAGAVLPRCRCECESMRVGRRHVLASDVICSSNSTNRRSVRPAIVAGPLHILVAQHHSAESRSDVGTWTPCVHLLMPIRMRKRKAWAAQLSPAQLSSGQYGRHGRCTG